MHSVCRLAALTVCLLAVVAAEYASHARPPRIGFHAMRGKRVGSWTEEEEKGAGPAVGRPRRFSFPLLRMVRIGDLYEDLYTRNDRTPLGPGGLRGKKAPPGFGGLRGKRLSGDFDDLRYKKIPSGFSGLRGKKIPRGFSGLRGKKIPSGFGGLRGKKILEEFSGPRGKKIPRGFSGVRGKRRQSGAGGFGETEQAPTSMEQQLTSRLMELSNLPTRDTLRQMEEAEPDRAPSRSLLARTGQYWLPAEE